MENYLGKALIFPVIETSDSIKNGLLYDYSFKVHTRQIEILFTVVFYDHDTFLTKIS